MCWFLSQPLATNCAVALMDHLRLTSGGTAALTATEPVLSFSAGSLITNVDTCGCEEGLWRGDHRGDKGMLLPSSHVRLLTKDEMEFVSDLVSQFSTFSLSLSLSSYYLHMGNNYVY